MRIPGERVKRTRWVRTESFAVAVEVEAVLPLDDPTEPCCESETVRLLKDIQEHAERGDIDWLLKHGTVYRRLRKAA